MTNVLIIFMQIRYIEVFDLTDPRYNERISSSLGSSLKRGSTVLLLRRESGFFSKTVKFPDNRIKTTSISFKTVHFIFYPLF